MVVQHKRLKAVFIPSKELPANPLRCLFSDPGAGDDDLITGYRPHDTASTCDLLQDIVTGDGL